MNNTNLKPEIPKDISRFNRWVNNFDEKDKSLTSHKRKQKWLLLTGGTFVLFLMSFLFFPSAKPGASKLSPPFINAENPVLGTEQKSAFELPVDSFENQLKTIIHEDIPEKK